ncbi:AAA family ATPase [Geodermatophilus sp. SYSU D00867]
MTAAEDALLPRLFDRIVEACGSGSLGDRAGDLVLAAYQGDAELAAAVTSTGPREEPEAPAAAVVDVPRTYLKSITVAGFRGIGPERSLRLQPGPGLTLVVGRNGSGKSSFAEAAEMALTGSNARWKDRAAAWTSSWRNLHSSDADPSVGVELVVDGQPGVTKVLRTWAGDDVEESQASVQQHGGRRELRELGWDEALVSYRPFLSYAELGAMLSGRPSDLYDSLFRILGLERVVHAQTRLKAECKRLKDAETAVKQARKVLLADLEGVDDDRARRVAAVLGQRTPDLDALREVLRAETEPMADLAPLRAWAALPVPDLDPALAAADRLEAAAAAVAALSGDDSEQARWLADLLEAALVHAGHTATTDCPVCGATDRLDDAWRTATRGEVARLRERAGAAEDTHRELRAARAAAAAAVPSPPRLVETVPAGVPGEGLAERWRTWAAAARDDDASVAAAALREVTAGLVTALQDAVAAARAELGRREDVWQPLAQRLREHVDAAEAVFLASDVCADLQAAEKWLKAQTDGLRDEGLAPIAERAARTWQELRQESNVDLGPVRLEGSATRRRVALDVTVDGEASAALGVMSQGEVHALGLALFLPRAMLEQSPFRFLVIDDPVQAMDPAKVDGLARVLAEVAGTHQVVVFTHDDRLPEAARRLQLGATIWEVTRRERSVVELRKSEDPVARYLDDARAVALTRDLGEAAQRLVVPGLCRSAIEAACHEVVRTRRLASGVRHAEVEEVLAGARTTTATMALALFDDAAEGGQVLPTLDRRFGRRAADAFRSCKEGAHGGHDGLLADLVRDVEQLVASVRQAAFR